MSSGGDQSATRVDLEPGAVRFRGCPECVGDGAVVTLVLVGSRDLDDGGARVGHLHDVGLVDVVLEFWRVVVYVGHLEKITRHILHLYTGVNNSKSMAKHKKNRIKFV